MALTLAGAVLLVCAPLLRHGPLPLGSDVYATCHYLQGFMKAFAEGDLYPRWTDRTNTGLGAPSFVLVPPAAYYAAGGLSWLAGSLIVGLKLFWIAIAALSAASFYLLARQWVGPGIPAALAAALYLLLPYRVLDMYQRFAISESASFIFFPLILLFMRRTILVGRAADFAGLALSYAGLIYTHLVSALLFSVVIGPWLLWEARGRWRALLRPTMALACGMGLAAPALLPAVVEKEHANIAWTREMPNGDYRINFIFKDDPLPELGFKDPVKPPVLRSAHSQLVLAGLAAACALAWTDRAQRRRRADVIALCVACGLAYFMQTGLSTPVWMVVPQLPSVQFPWRFQTIMVLATALLVGFGLSAGWGRAAGSRARSRSLVAPAAILLATVAALNLGLAVQNAHLKSFLYDEQADGRPFVTEWIEPAFTPIEFESYRRFKQTPIVMPQAAFVRGEGSVTPESWKSSSRDLSVRSDAGGTVELRSFWFPGWTASLDGAPLELTPAQITGVVRFDVPPGSHTVTLRFAPTPVRRAATLIALLGAGATISLAWWSPRLRAALAEGART